MYNYLSEQQKRAVKALEILQTICNENSINLFLVAGTALGAVRHKGMIPWDDDVDVGLLYYDWMKLRKILREDYLLKKHGYMYIDDVNSSKYPRVYGKILFDGLGCIDIFLLAKWTTNKILGQLQWQIRSTLIEFYQLSVDYDAYAIDRKDLTPIVLRRRKIIHFLRRLLFKFVHCFADREVIIKWIRNNEKRFEKSGNCYINIYSVYSMEKELLDQSWIANPETVTFEGREYIAPGPTDAYLKHLYGDYMTPPTDSERMNRMHIERFDQYLEN